MMSGKSNMLKSGLSMWTYLVVVLFLTRSIVGQVVADGEPRCLSRYDYDYKMMKKLLEMEMTVKNLQKTVDNQFVLIEKMKKREAKDRGSLYTRWGKSSCPGDGTDLAYTGFMAGTLFDHKSTSGAGGNYLCLSSEPLWGHYDNSLNNGIRITGVEYEFNPYQSQIRSFFGKDIQGKKAPCSVCRSKKTTTLMIPGRNQCYDGWTKDYSGYLVTGYPGYSDSSEFICLDSDPDVLINSEKSFTDNMLYFVEGKCGESLTCPPYVDGREITCVVCSQ